MRSIRTSILGASRADSCITVNAPQKMLRSNRTQKSRDGRLALERCDDAFNVPTAQLVVKLASFATVCACTILI